MDYRVYHPNLISEPLNVNSSTVQFDANGISEELTREDFKTLLSIPSYLSLEEYWETLAKDEVDTCQADLGGGEVLPAAAEPTPEQAEADDTEEPEGDLTLLQQVLTDEFPEDAFAALPLIERLDVASNPELTQDTAELLFDTESKGRKSKRVLTELDRRLQILRAGRTAASVTDSMLRKNYPRQEER